MTIVTKYLNIKDWSTPEIPPLVVGDHVRKRDGAKFEGVIVVIFTTLEGNERCVVEAIDLKFAGNLHIYNLNQLELIKFGIEPKEEIR